MTMNRHRLFCVPAAIVLVTAVLGNLPLRNKSIPQSVDLLTATAADLTALLRSGTITSTHLVDEYLARVGSSDRNGLRLNSIISLVADAQLHATAAALDEERRNGIERSPLHGIPYILKDNYATDRSFGLPTTGGAFALINSTARESAIVVDRLRNAGAILLGKANLDELNGFKGDNLGSGWSKVGGTTRSAYNFKTPCGSSGGSAVAVSAGFAPMALGSETTGSLSCPASHAALYGFVASTGLVPSRGIIPASSTFDRPGFLAKSAIDLMHTISVTANADKALLDCLVNAEAVGPDRFFWKSLRIGRVHPDFFGKAHGGYHDATAELKMYENFSNTLESMKKLGARVNMNATMPSATDLPSSWDDLKIVISHEMKHGLVAFLAETIHSTVYNLSELINFNRENWLQALQKDGLESPQGQEFLERSQQQNLSHEEYSHILDKLHRLAVTDGIEHVLREHDLDVLAVPGWSWLSVYSAVAGAPSGTVPLGRYPDGRPYGITFVAQQGQDCMILQLMRQYEASFPTRQVPASMRSILANTYYRIWTMR